MRSGGEDQGGSVQCDYIIIYFLDFSSDWSLKKYFNQDYALNTEIKSKTKTKLSCQKCYNRRAIRRKTRARERERDL